jgi:hypothetical protein
MGFITETVEGIQQIEGRKILLVHSDTAGRKTVRVRRNCDVVLVLDDNTVGGAIDIVIEPEDLDKVDELRYYVIRPSYRQDLENVSDQHRWATMGNTVTFKGSPDYVEQRYVIRLSAISQAVRFTRADGFLDGTPANIKLVAAQDLNVFDMYAVMDNPHNPTLDNIQSGQVIETDFNQFDNRAINVAGNPYWDMADSRNFKNIDSESLRFFKQKYFTGMCLTTVSYYSNSNNDRYSYFYDGFVKMGITCRSGTGYLRLYNNGEYNNRDLVLARRSASNGYGTTYNSTIAANTTNYVDLSLLSTSANGRTYYINVMWPSINKFRNYLIEMTRMSSTSVGSIITVTEGNTYQVKMYDS